MNYSLFISFLSIMYKNLHDFVILQCPKSVSFLPLSVTSIVFFLVSLYIFWTQNLIIQSLSWVRRAIYFTVIFYQFLAKNQKSLETFWVFIFISLNSFWSLFIRLRLHWKNRTFCREKVFNQHFLQLLL